jgi:hypothetical protein
MEQMLQLHSLRSQIAYFPLKQQAGSRKASTELTFCAAKCSVVAAEIAQMPRMDRLMPPLCDRDLLLLSLLQNSCQSTAHYKKGQESYILM